jgi:hypothetical protein
MRPLGTRVRSSTGAATVGPQAPDAGPDTRCGATTVWWWFSGTRRGAEAAWRGGSGTFADDVVSCGGTGVRRCAASRGAASPGAHGSVLICG